MKNCLLAVVGCAMPLFAEEGTNSWTRYFGSKTVVGVYSAYVYRGRILCNEPVWQPSETLTLNLPEDLGAVHGLAWSSLYLTPGHDPSRFAGMQSLDYIANYTKSLGPVDLDLGHFWYTYPNSDTHSTGELFAGAKYNNAYVTPMAYVWWDYADTGGNDPDTVFAEFALSHAFALTDKLSLDVSSGFGVADGAYMRYKCGVNSAEFNYFRSGLALSYAVSEQVTVGASLVYWYELSHTVRHSGYDCEDDYNQILVGGVNVALKL